MGQKKGHIVSQETRRKLSEVLRGRPDLDKIRHKLTRDECRNRLGTHLTEEHKRKVSENNAHYWLGKHLSEETKRKLSEINLGENHPRYGKSVSIETCQRISKALLGNTNCIGHKNGVGNIPWNKGAKNCFSEETLKKMSLSLKGRKSWNKGKKNVYTEETLQKIRDARLSQIIPVKNTSIEIALQEELKKRNINFETHLPLLGKYQADIFIQPNIVIEADGDYWHNLPNRQIWDEKRNEKLINAGYEVHHFLGSEIKENVENCVDQIFGGKPI